MTFGLSFQKDKQTPNKNTVHTVQTAFRKGGRWRGEEKMRAAQPEHQL